MARIKGRFYLCGIHIGDGLMASTNGHIALVVESPETIGMDLIVPAETIDSLVKKVGNNPMMKTVDLHQLETIANHIFEVNGIRRYQDKEKFLKEMANHQRGKGLRNTFYQTLLCVSALA